MNTSLLRRLALFALPLALAAFIASGCGNDEDTDSSGLASDVVCEVNGDKISKTSLDTAIANTEQLAQQQGEQIDKSSKEYRENVRSLVARLVEQQVFLQEAKRRDITVSDEDVDKRHAAMIKEIGGEASYKATLKQQGLTDKQAREQTRQDLIMQRIFEDVAESVEVDDAEVRKVFSQHNADLQVPQHRKIAHIMVADKAQAQRIYEQVKNGDEKMFTKLAEEYSLDSISAEKGGVMELYKGEAPPAFEKVAFGLDRGEVVGPIKTDLGWHVITERGPLKASENPSYSSVKQRLTNQIRYTQAGLQLQELRVNLLREADVTCRDKYKWDTKAITKQIEEQQQAASAQAQQQGGAAPGAPAGQGQGASSRPAGAGTQTSPNAQTGPDPNAPVDPNAPDTSAK